MCNTDILYCIFISNLYYCYLLKLLKHVTINVQL